MADIVPLASALPEIVKASEPTLVAPHSVAAEQALLGALMVNNKQYDTLLGSLQAEHFYVPLHASIFDALEKLINRGREANPITVREMLRGTPYDDESTLFSHLSAMFENAGLGSDVRSLAEVIHTTYLQRQLMALGEGLKAQASGAHRRDEVAGVLDSVSGEMFRLAETGSASTTVRGMREPLIEVIRRAEQARADGSGITGVATGFVDMDRMLGGFQRSDLIILAARPSMGKTALALNFAQRCAERLLHSEPNGAAVGVFSLEMSADQLAGRLLAGRSEISSHQLNSGQLSNADFTRLQAAAGELAEVPLYIDDTPALSINQLRARARQMKRQYGIGLLIVDYLQLMQGSKSNGDNRVQEVSEISQGLKTVARDLNIPVIALSQLSRSVESRDNKRPQLSDLRESGSIEQDADIVMFLYREEYYLSRQMGAGDDMDPKALEMKEKLEKARGKAEVLISKNRKGPTGTVTLLFTPETTTFHNFTGYGPAPFDE